MEIQSILDGFYEVIMARLKTLVPEIKHIDIYFGQYDHPEVDDKGNMKALPFNRPATFFEWPPLRMEPLGLRRKKVTCEFMLHLVQDVVQEVDMRSSETVREKGHAHLDLVNKVVVAIEGFNGDQVTDPEGFKHFSAISFVEWAPYATIGLHIIHVPKFRVRIVYDAAKKFYTKLSDLTPPVVANDEIEGDVQQL